MVFSCQKTQSGLTFLCNDKTMGPGQDAAVVHHPAAHLIGENMGQEVIRSQETNCPVSWEWTPGRDHSLGSLQSRYLLPGPLFRTRGSALSRHLTGPRMSQGTVNSKCPPALDIVLEVTYLQSSISWTDTGSSTTSAHVEAMIVIQLQKM